MDSPVRAELSRLVMAPEVRLHTFEKGVWLEMGDYMGYFMDVILLNFSHHPSQFQPFTPHLKMSTLVFEGARNSPFTPLANSKRSLVRNG